jgi:hypothetical protein
MSDPRDWFRPKIIGFGYSPRTWEGWTITGAVLLAIVTVGKLLH